MAHDNMTVVWCLWNWTETNKKKTYDLKPISEKVDPIVKNFEVEMHKDTRSCV